jgi:hypothetical protein
MKRLQWRFSEHRRTDRRTSDRPWYAGTYGKGVPGAILKEPLKDRRSRRNDGRARNAKIP